MVMIDLNQNVYTHPMALAIPTRPTKIQNTFNKVYALSFFNIAHQDRSKASKVLNIHTNKKGLFSPNQLTNEKLIIRIITPIISKMRTCLSINSFIFLIILLLIQF